MRADFQKSQPRDIHSPRARTDFKTQKNAHEWNLFYLFPKYARFVFLQKRKKIS